MRLAFVLSLSLVALGSAQAPGRDAAPIAAPARAAATPAVARPVTGTASIAGVVNDDAGHPVRRAMVTVTGDMRVTVSTVTDDVGRFTIRNLPAGRFTIAAKKAAYPSTSYGARKPNRPGAGIVVGDGQAVSGLVLKLARGAVVSGTVYDDRGQPMPGVPIMAWEVRASLSGARTLTQPSTGGVWVTTDDRGAYRIFGLPPGEYTVGTAWIYDGMPSAVRVPTDDEIRAAFAAASGQGPAPRTPAAAGAAATSSPVFNFTPVFYPDSLDPLSASTVQLAAGDERDGLDVHMQFVPMSHVEGTVIGPDGAAVRSTLNLVWRTDVQALNKTMVWPAIDGHFSTPSLGPGRYLVQATGIGGAANGMWAEADVTVAGPDPISLALHLAPSMTMTGRVAFDGTAPVPADLSTIRVNLLPVANGGPGGGGSATVTASGAFTMNNLRPGTSVVAANLAVPGGARPTWTVKSVVADGRDVTDRPLNIVAGSAPSLVITFTDQTSELSGTLTDAAGQPATDYFVVVLPADRQQWTVLSRRIASTRPDIHGHYVFSNLPAGDYRIAATTDLVQGDLRDLNALAGIEAQSTPVTLALGEKKTFDLAIAAPAAR